MGDSSSRSKETRGGIDREQTMDLIRIADGSYHVIVDGAQEKEANQFLKQLGSKEKNGERNEDELTKDPTKLKNKHQRTKIEYYTRKGGRKEKLILFGEQKYTSPIKADLIKFLNERDIATNDYKLENGPPQ